MAGLQMVNKKSKFPLFAPNEVIFRLQYIFVTGREDLEENKVITPNLINPLRPKSVPVRTSQEILLLISKCSFKPFLYIFRSNNYDIRV